MQTLTALPSPRRAVAAAATLIALTSNSTATSAVFVAYRTHWGLTAADIGLAFAVYVGTLIPVLLLFGGMAERFGRRCVICGRDAPHAGGNVDPPVRRWPTIARRRPALSGRWSGIECRRGFRDLH